MDKTQLRRKLRTQRLGLCIDQRKGCHQKMADFLTEWLALHPELKRLFFYQSIQGEPDLTSFFQSQGAHYQWALPRITNCHGIMEFHRFQNGDKLIVNKFGIREPHPGVPQIPGRDSLVLAPCLGLSVKGYRLGYGGGYYDRFLAELPHVKVMGVTYSFAMFLNFDEQHYDIPVDFSLSEFGICQFNQE